MVQNDNSQTGFQNQTNDIRIRLIENAVLVSAHGRWYSFDSWEAAAVHVAARLVALRQARLDSQRVEDGK